MKKIRPLWGVKANYVPRPIRIKMLVPKREVSECERFRFWMEQVFVFGDALGAPMPEHAPCPLCEKGFFAIWGGTAVPQSFVKRFRP